MHRSFKSPAATLFGRRLRELRCKAEISQEKLGVMIGLDEGTVSARISRYEAGIHEPPLLTVEKIASALKAPLPYFYCPDDDLARLILTFWTLDDGRRTRTLAFVEELAKEMPEQA